VGGQNHEWTYDSPEGRSNIAADMAAAQGLKVAPVAAGTIAESLALYGRIQPNAERLRSVTARFPGLVQEVSVRPGDRVAAGARLAVIESNESLRSYTVTAPIAGTVVSRHVNPGESAGSGALFEIADFSTVWAELSLFPRDRPRLRVGQAAVIAAADGGATAAGRVTQVAPLGLAGQPLTARVLLDNAQAQWTPGQFVNAEVTVSRTPVALAVPLAALQRFRDWDIVAVNEGDQYQLQPVQLGRRDAAQVEVLAGLAPGARIVVANSYLVKADVEKSGAAHDH
jgi:cobalt-zinc-cadmium efflux system membrane fusion protein